MKKSLGTRRVSLLEVNNYKFNDHLGEEKKRKDSRMSSRDGSIMTKRYRKGISSVNSRRDKSTKSKVWTRKIQKNSKSIITFNEFKNEEKVNQEIGMMDDKISKSKSDLDGQERENLEYDGSHLDEAVSYQYSYGDRS